MIGMGTGSSSKGCDYNERRQHRMSRAGLSFVEQSQQPRIGRSKEMDEAA